MSLFQSLAKRFNIDPFSPGSGRLLKTKLRRNILNELKFPIIKNEFKSQKFINNLFTDFDNIKENYKTKDQNMMKSLEIIQRSLRENVNLNNNIHFTELKHYVKRWENFHNNNHGKFAIQLRSGQADVKHTFKFNHIKHFNNWFKKAIKESEVAHSDSFQEVYQIELGELQSMFGDHIIVENITTIKGGCNKNKAIDKEFKSSFYKFNVHRPVSRNNNCFFKAVEYLTGDKLDIKKLHLKHGIKTNEMVSINKAYEILQTIETCIEIISIDHNEELDEDIKYIILKEEHYYPVISFEQNERKNNKTKRGLLAFDLETRKTEKYTEIKATGTKMYILKDSLCCVYYHSYKGENQTLVLESNASLSSSRQFINFLNSEATHNRSYNIIAHNGGKFDFYFIISEMTELELMECDISMRGTTIIGINYRGNLFRDSCCFMQNTLENLSESFKIEHGKLTKLNLHGNDITSSQLCFYKPELNFNDFLELKTDDPEYWGLYVKYCIYDCIALYEIWSKFTACVNNLVNSINPYLLQKCPLMSSMTIGSHSKKIVVEMNKYNRCDNYYFKDLQRFTGIEWMEVRNGKPMTERQEYAVNAGTLNKNLFYKHVQVIDRQKYDFINNFKRGGISHCHQPGKHTNGITGVDIASQYPSSLIYAYIPTGKSFWLKEGSTYNPKFHGFYLLKDLQFETKYNLKPVAVSHKGQSLSWSNDKIDELYVDSYMIDYLMANYGLKSFYISKALVSYTDTKADKFFGKYINTFYDEKKEQDSKKKNNDVSYNPALRETIKLYMNSLTGKLNENPDNHYSLQLNQESQSKFNNVGYEKVYNHEKINEWITAGVMIYSYSKRLLFEYIKCLPNDSDDVIHIETDGIYFSTEHYDTFTKNLNTMGTFSDLPFNEIEYPIKFGDDLGNLKIEKSTKKGTTSYFLGKKFYAIAVNNDYNGKTRDDEDGNIYRIKGAPQKTINDDGSKKYLVEMPLYEKIYAGKSVDVSFATLKKNLFCEKTSISSYVMTRKIKPNCEYKEY